MVSLGLNETLSYILINDKEADKFTLDEFEKVLLSDPMTEERNTLRYSMIPSLLKIYEYNKARNVSDISIFEIGKGFYKRNGEYGEDLKLCALMSGKYFDGIGKTVDVDFYVIKGIAEIMLDYLGYSGRYSIILKDNMPKEFHKGQTAYISVNNDDVGIIGRVHPRIQKEPTYVLEINLSRLLDKKVGKMKYKEISKFPNVKKDLAIIVDDAISSQELETAIKKAGGSLLTKIQLFDIYKGENIEQGKKSLAYSLTFEDKNKTLTDEEINNLLQKIIETLESKLGAILRK